MIASLRLQNFRAYHDALFEFQPGVNIIVGPNASGKTNLLEAILVLASGSSYRVKDYELLSFDAPWARLDGQLIDGSSRTIKLQTEPQPSKHFEIAGKLYKRIGLPQRMPVVLFEPNHLSLLTGSPERRRNYLDEILEQTEPGYATVLRRYKRTLAQRNALLKQSSTETHTQMFTWNVRLAELAGQIVRLRTDLVRLFAQELGAYYAQLSHARSVLTMAYNSIWPVEHYESRMLQKLEMSFELDRLRGFTASGPHREDFTVELNGHPTTETASRGETRTAVLALKILELKHLEAVRAQPPMLLLDDVFSELDGARRRALTNQLRSYQTYITTTDADIVIQHFTETTTIIPLGSD